MGKIASTRSSEFDMDVRSRWRFTPLEIARENLRRRPFRTFCMTTFVALLAFVLSGGSLLAFSLSRGNRKKSPQLFIATTDSQHCAFPVRLIGYVPKSDFVIEPWLQEQIPDDPKDGEASILFTQKAG